MATEILMPALSPTMEEGTLTRWLVKEGDSVASGDILAEIETDKATMEFEAVDEGVIGKLLYTWVTPFLKLGLEKEQLDLDDLLPLPPAYLASNNAPRFEHELLRACPKGARAVQLMSLIL